MGVRRRVCIADPSPRTLNQPRDSFAKFCHDQQMRLHGKWNYAVQRMKKRRADRIAAAYDEFDADRSIGYHSTGKRKPDADGQFR